MSIPPETSVSTTLQIEKKKTDLDKARAEVIGQHIKNATEAAKSLGIVVALVLSAWANFTKANASEVEEAKEKTKASLELVAGDIEDQHEQTEKIREAVEGTTEAVKTIASASAAPAAPGIEVSGKEPDEKGCWTVYGGIVRCKGLDDAASANPKGAAPVAVPTTPPPAPLPKAAGGKEGERFTF